MTKITELMENATREELLAILNKIVNAVESHEEVEWESNCPVNVLDSGNFDDTWEAGQDNGESYMANHIEGLIRSSLTRPSDA